VKINGDREWTEDLISDIVKISGGMPAGATYQKHLGRGRATNQIGIRDLGTAHKIIVNRNKTLIVPMEEQKPEMQEHIKYLRDLLSNESDPVIRAYISERISRVSDGVAFLEIGGLTEQSTSERADRIEDAVCAVNAARKSGVIPGAGLGYLYGAELIRNKGKKGYDILVEAIDEMITILHNGLPLPMFAVDLAHSQNPTSWQGYNLREDKMCNLYETGILDPTEVNIETVQNAVSVASILLKTRTFITHSKEMDLTAINPMNFLNKKGNPLNNF